jgi:hypothetical protein
MANNRLYLKCGVCRKQTCLLKYYPRQGWYLPLAPARRLDIWLDDHRHGDESMYGPTHFTVEYEVAETP